jgi:uncharacterized membrane protein
MAKGRLEAFSDGVIAILITIMVLELKVPRGTDFSSLQPMLPVFISYIVSFLYLAIYWNNHHHMLHACRRINGAVLWANMHLLFWLSLVPAVTGWIGVEYDAPAPTAIYGMVLLLAAVAYYVLQNTIIAAEGEHSLLAKAVGRDLKGKLSLVLYACAIALSFLFRPAAHGIYILVALMWLVPDRRIERTLQALESGDGRRT